MEVHHLMSYWIRTTECWPAKLNASSTTMSHALEQTNATRLGVICQSPSSKLLTSFQLIFQSVSPAYTLQLPASCVLHPALKKFCPNKRALLERTSWDISWICLLLSTLPRIGPKTGACSKETVLRIGFMMDHQSDYWARCNTCQQQNDAGRFAYASWLEVLLHFLTDIRSEIHEYRPLSSCHALPADRRNKVLECWLTTLDASSAKMSHAFGTNKCCSNRSHLPECCLKAPHFLLARVQLSTNSPISLSRCSFPLSVCCTLLSRNPVPTNKLRILEQIGWHICCVGACKYPI